MPLHLYSCHFTLRFFTFSRCPKYRGIETMRFRRRIKWSSYIKASCGIALVLLLLRFGPYENGGFLRDWGLRLRRNDGSFENILNSTLGVGAFNHQPSNFLWIYTYFCSLPIVLFISTHGSTSKTEQFLPQVY
jgi:hypothetical protein